MSIIGKPYLDPRDIASRIAELEEEREDYTQDDEFTYEDWENDCEDDAEELEALTEFRTDYGGDLDNGETLIHEDEFETYARNLAEGIGAVRRDSEWPTNCIDWELAADQLRHDYTAYDINGETYYAHA